MDKKVLLLVAAAVCVGIYFYGSQVKKDSEVMKWLPAVGGIAFVLNTLIQITQ